jgi:hypothetical protein
MTTISDINLYIKTFNRPNQFDFLLNTPSMMKIDSETQKQLRIFGKSLSIPSMHGDIKPNFFFNRKFNTPTFIDVDNIIITFYDTHTMYFHRFFMTWLIDRFDINGALKYYPSEYSGSMGIHTHNELIYTLSDFFPIAVSDYRLDNDIVDSFGTFDVTFYVGKMLPNKLPGKSGLL